MQQGHDPPRKGKIEMVTQVDQESRHVVYEDVEFVPGFKQNFLLYMSLDTNGVWLRYESDKRYLISKSGSEIAEVQWEGNDLVIRGELSGALTNTGLVCSVVESQEEVSKAVHENY